MLASICHAVGTQKVAWSTPPSSGGRSNKRSWIDPGRDRLASGRRQRNSGHQIRTLIVCIAVRGIRRALVNRNVQGEPSSSKHKRTDFPGTEAGAQMLPGCSSGLFQCRKEFVDGIEIHNLACAECPAGTLI